MLTAPKVAVAGSAQVKSSAVVPVPVNCSDSPAGSEPNSSAPMSVLVIPSAGPPHCDERALVGEELDDGSGVVDQGDAVGGAVLDPVGWIGDHLHPEPVAEVGDGAGQRRSAAGVV